MFHRILVALVLLSPKTGLQFATCDDFDDGGFEEGEDDDIGDESEYDYEEEDNVWILEAQTGGDHQVSTIEEGHSVVLNCTAVSAVKENLELFQLSWEYLTSGTNETSSHQQLSTGNVLPSYTEQTSTGEIGAMYASVSTLQIESARLSDSGKYECRLKSNESNATSANNEEIYEEGSTMRLTYELKVVDKTVRNASAPEALTGIVLAVSTSKTIIELGGTSSVPTQASESQWLDKFGDGPGHAPSLSKLMSYETAMMNCCMERGLQEMSCLHACIPDARSQVQLSWTDTCRWAAARAAMMCYMQTSSRLLSGLTGRPATDASTFGTRECCMQRKVSAACMHVCLGYNVFSEDEHCLAQFGRILECALSRFHANAVPDPPRFVRVVPISPTRIRVRWLPPARSSKKIAGYEVFYALETPSATVGPNATELTRSAEYKRLLTGNLSVSILVGHHSTVSVYLQAFNEHGFSAPSEEVRTQTSRSLFDVLRVVRLTNVNHGGDVVQAANQHILDCCARFLPAQCAAVLCAPNVTSADLRDIDVQHAEVVDQCLFALPDVLRCYANRRNVTQCCVREYVSASCVPFCAGETDQGRFDLSNQLERSGQSDQAAFTHQDCIFEFPRVRECFVRGWLYVPSPPRALQFVRMTCTRQNATCDVELMWLPPLENAKLVESFVVHVLAANAFADPDLSSQHFMSLSVLATSEHVRIDALPLGLKYEFAVVAVANFGQSVASNRVLVSTPLPNAELPYFAERNASLNSPCQLVARVVSRTSESMQISWDNFGDESCGNDHSAPQNDTNFDNAPSRHYMVSYSILFPPADSSSFANKSLANQNVIVERNAEKTVILHNLRSAAQYEVTLQLLDSISSVPLARTTLIEWTTESSSRYFDSSSYWLNRRRAEEARALLNNSNNFNSSRSGASNFTRLHSCCTEAAESRRASPDCIKSMCSVWAYEQNDGLEDSVIAHCTFVEVNQLFSCFSGDADRSLCCRMNYLPHQCTELCQGERTTASAGYGDLRLALCAPHLAKARSCVLDDTLGYFPARPNVELAYALNDSAILVSWKDNFANESVLDSGGRFVVFYKKSNDSYDDTKTFAVGPSAQHALISQLQPGTTYDAYVVAMNHYGASLPSTLVSVQTYATDESFLHIVHSPRSTTNVHPQGSTLTLRCITPVQYAYSLVWYRNGNRLQVVPNRVLLIGQHNETLVFNTLNRFDVGRYTCSVTLETGSPLVSQSTFVNVQHEPTVLVSDYLVHSSLFDTKTITCVFGGLPTSVRWFHIDSEREVQPSGATLQPIEASGAHFEVQTVSYPSDPTTHSVLTIYGVTLADFGSYCCVAQNQFGNVNNSIELQPYLQHLDVQVAADSKGQEEHAAALQQCCASAQLSANCMSLCTYSLLDATNWTASSLRSCMRDDSWQNVSTIWKCLVAGRDHRPCCSQLRIPPPCLPLCAGQLPVDQSTMFKCFNYRLDMMRCVREGLATIPRQPSQITSSSSYDDTSRIASVTLAWTSTPNDRLLTQNFRIHMFNVSSNKLLATELITPSSRNDDSTQTETYQYEMRLFVLQSHQYALTVTAVGPFGCSLPTPLLITTNISSSSALSEKDFVSTMTTLGQTESVGLSVPIQHDDTALIAVVCILLLLFSGFVILLLVLLFRKGFGGLSAKLRGIRSAIAHFFRSIRNSFPRANCSRSATTIFTQNPTIAAESTVDIPLECSRDCSNVNRIIKNEAADNFS